MFRFKRIDRTVTIAMLAAVVGGVIVFRIFTKDYVEWITLKYPENHAMAPIQGFMYGVPVAGVCGFLIFCAVIFWKK